MIDGVRIKELKVFSDDRGIFSEVFRNSEDIFDGVFGQVSYSMSFGGVAKAWHLHKKQTDWMCALIGDVKLALFDLRENSRTKGELMEILMGQTLGRKVVRVPPGIAHGYRVINGPMHMIYVMDREYDAEDELRIPHDDPSIGYDWTALPPIK